MPEREAVFDVVMFTGHRDKIPGDRREFVELMARFGLLGKTWIHGGAKGFDRWVGKRARELGISVEIFPADWGRHGRGAGMIRNREMVEQADICVAGWDGRNTGGTYHAMRCALKKGIPVIALLVDLDPDLECHRCGKEMLAVTDPLCPECWEETAWRQPANEVRDEIRDEAPSAVNPEGED